MARGRAGSKPEGRAERAIREALDVFAAGPVRDEILRRALAAEALTEIPDSPHALRAWIAGPLREAVESLFDGRTAGALVETLEPIVDLVETGERGSRSGAAPCALFCLELAPSIAQTIVERVTASASVVVVEDHLMLAAEVRKAQADALCVLVDCREAPPRAGRLGAVARQLPGGVRVVLWGAGQEDTRLLAISHREIDWFPIGPSSTVDEVIALCTVPTVSGARRRPTLATESVLIVQHDAGRRRALGETLAALGYAVSMASSGAEALAKCSRRRPSLLIVDQLLPGMSGTEVARLLHNAASDEAPPVLLLVRDVVETADLGSVAAAVPDGVSDDKLALLLRKLIGQARMEGAVTRSDITAKKTPQSE